ncbi:hypothetical protein [Candidatus Uabimicrobium sp. HlEnr_7]|uniref:hypothetical protein n=1 Tax=Candidatus Uabimicrobium helgolandensis TaxID=3095367 RepID=UPI0035591D8D
MRRKLHICIFLIYFVFLLSMVNAEIITSIDFTGQELLNDPNTVFPNGNRQPVDNGDGTITFNEGAVNFIEIMSRTTILAPGTANNVSVDITADITPLTDDNDLFLSLSDGINTSGFIRLDNGGGQLSFSTAEDGGDILNNPNFNLDVTNAAFSDIFSISFSIEDGVTTLQANMSGIFTPLIVSDIPLDASLGLTLLLSGNNAAERYQVNNLSATVSTVPEPSSYILLFICLLIFRYKTLSKRFISQQD